MDSDWNKLKFQNDNQWLEKITDSTPTYLPSINTGRNKELDEHLEEMYERNRKVYQAQLETAENTGKMKGQLDRIICNQNDYIDMLKEHNNHILQELQNIFGSQEDSVMVQKEIFKLMKEQNVNENLLKDKGMDAFIQALFMCINILLVRHGINL